MACNTVRNQNCPDPVKAASTEAVWVYKTADVQYWGSFQWVDSVNDALEFTTEEKAGFMADGREISAGVWVLRSKQDEQILVALTAAQCAMLRSLVYKAIGNAVPADVASTDFLNTLVDQLEQAELVDELEQTEGG